MIREVEEFLRRSHAHTPACKEYASMVYRCKSVKELFDTALDIQSVEFVSKAIDDGWCIDSADIQRIFNAYVNGKYVREKDGYKSVMYCNYCGEAVVEQTVVFVIDSEITLFLPDYAICKVFIAGCSNVHFKGGGTAFIEHLDHRASVDRADGNIEQ